MKNRSRLFFSFVFLLSLLSVLTECQQCQIGQQDMNDALSQFHPITDFEKRWLASATGKLRRMPPYYCLDVNELNHHFEYFPNPLTYSQRIEAAKSYKKMSANKRFCIAFQLVVELNKEEQNKGSFWTESIDLLRFRAGGFFANCGKHADDSKWDFVAPRDDSKWAFYALLPYIIADSIVRDESLREELRVAGLRALKFYASQTSDGAGAFKHQAELSAFLRLSE